DMELRLARLPPFLDKGALLDANDEVMELIEKSKDAFRGENRHKMWSEFSHKHFGVYDMRNDMLIKYVLF
ncbi:hypothetical protein ABTO05_21640, partial [Acinetobacter baumannii]